MFCLLSSGGSDNHSLPSEVKDKQRELALALLKVAELTSQLDHLRRAHTPEPKGGDLISYDVSKDVSADLGCRQFDNAIKDSVNDVIIKGKEHGTKNGITDDVRIVDDVMKSRSGANPSTRLQPEVGLKTHIYFTFQIIILQCFCHKLF